MCAKGRLRVAVLGVVSAVGAYQLANSNDAMRPQAAFPFGLGRNAASALASGLRMEPPFGSAALRASIRIATQRISCFSVSRPYEHDRRYHSVSRDRLIAANRRYVRCKRSTLGANWSKAASLTNTSSAAASRSARVACAAIIFVAVT